MKKILTQAYASRKKKILGHVDVLRRGTVEGWALDSADHLAELYIRIMVNGRVVHEGIANLEREDLLRAGHPSANHGFSFYVPELALLQGSAAFVAEAENRSRGTRSELQPIAEVQNEIDARFGNYSDSFTTTKDTKAILLDIQDIMEFLKDHNGVTGIQRVVGGLVQTLARRQEANVVFCEIGKEDQTIRIFDTEATRALVEDAMAGDQPQAKMTAAVHGIRSTARIHQPDPGDVYFILGAYWVVPDFAPRLNALKRNGVIIGTYIYDLIPITAPEWVTDGTRAAVTDRAIDILFLSDFFLTISEFVAEEVRRLLLLETKGEKPVEAVPLPHQLPPKREQTSQIRDALKGLQPYVLAVGTLEGRKNHMLLFRIWAALLRAHGADKVPKLVLVGRWGWNIERFRESFEASAGLRGHIQIFHNLGDSELTYLYDNCLFSCFVSFVEGWGLPVGEALAAGKLCLCSDRTSIPEVGGDLCVYVDPYDYLKSYETFERHIFDVPLREQKTERIAKEFRPRTWAEYSANMVARIRAVGSASPPVIPYVDGQRLVRLNWNALVIDQTLSWQEKTVKFSRTSGWWELEPWGVWAVAPKAIIRFRTCTPASFTSVMLELRLPPTVASPQSVHIKSGEIRETFTLSHKSFWYNMKAHTDETGVLELEFTSNFRPSSEPARDLFFGLSAFIYIPADATNSPVVSLLEQLGLAWDRRAMETADTKGVF